MAVKQAQLDGIGAVKLYKRRDSRSIKLTIAPDHVRVTMPMWMPYRAGLEFLKTKTAWVQKHQKPATFLISGQLIGKSHRLIFATANNAPNVKTYVSDTQITVVHTADTTLLSPGVQRAARQASVRALRRQANNLLPRRAQQLAEKHGFSYDTIRVRRLKSRWGSCSQQKNISLSIYLMQLPWELIDYVLLHELTHTKHLNHGKDFWDHMDNCLPGAKEMSRQLKPYQPLLW